MKYIYYAENVDHDFEHYKISDVYSSMKKCIQAVKDTFITEYKDKQVTFTELPIRDKYCFACDYEYEKAIKVKIEGIWFTHNIGFKKVEVK